MIREPWKAVSPVRLGLQLGYWGARPPIHHAELVAAAEESGLDTVFNR
jgi:alkanesulfonate monooxygenase SsuD/methylene tetrahydromethanopterin reductase-like flavin-dependent oxidoreductase (luciferase family)